MFCLQASGPFKCIPFSRYPSFYTSCDEGEHTFLRAWCVEVTCIHVDEAPGCLLEALPCSFLLLQVFCGSVHQAGCRGVVGILLWPENSSNLSEADALMIL